jgi:hypothetical protein
MRMNRWSKAGIVEGILRRLQLEYIVCVKVQMIALDNIH